MGAALGRYAGAVLRAQGGACPPGFVSLSNACRAAGSEQLPPEAAGPSTGLAAPGRGSRPTLP